MRFGLDIRVITGLLLAALVALGAGHASAQAEDPDARALRLYRAGETAFLAGEYQAAFDLFQSSFELSRRPGLLHNMALAADRLRRDDDAARLYDEYLQRVPEAANRPEIEARLRALREAIARHEQAPPIAPPSTGPAPAHDVTNEPWFWPVVGSGIALVLAGVVIGVAVGAQPTDEPYRVGDIGGVVFALEGAF